MAELFNRKTYFDHVRKSLFAGTMSQQQVDGQEAILSVWESIPAILPDLVLDMRWLAYMLATTYHETAQAMWPIEEYGKGEGHSYGNPDPETKQTYYGRGYVQLTWRDNYARADRELGLSGDDSCEWHAENALDSHTAAAIMFRGMYEGWFRSDGLGPQNLPRYFDDTYDDPFNAREIINGDKNTIPSWSNGVKIGSLIRGYHQDFLEALNDAAISQPEPAPEPSPQPEVPSIVADVTVTGMVNAQIVINGVLVWSTDAGTEGA